MPRAPSQAAAFRRHPQGRLAECGSRMQRLSQRGGGAGGLHLRKSRRFDSVRGLLEKVRHKLMTTKQSWRRSLSRNRSGAQSQERPQNVEAAEGEEGVEVSKKELLKQKDLLGVSSSIPLLSSDLASQSQSSPNTPAQLRKEKRHRSFSPVR